MSLAMPLAEAQLRDSSVARTGARVFILGVADMIRLVYQISWPEFIAIYRDTLAAHELLPDLETEAFARVVGDLASRHGEISKVMELGANSVRNWIVEKDAQAPMDLMVAIQFAIANDAVFSAFGE